MMGHDLKMNPRSVLFWFKDRSNKEQTTKQVKAILAWTLGVSQYNGIDSNCDIKYSQKKTEVP